MLVFVSFSNDRLCSMILVSSLLLQWWTSGCHASYLASNLFFGQFAFFSSFHVTLLGSWGKAWSWQQSSRPTLCGPMTRHQASGLNYSVTPTSDDFQKLSSHSDSCDNILVFIFREKSSQVQAMDWFHLNCKNDSESSSPSISISI